MEAIGLNPREFRARIVEPALGRLALPGGEAAIRLVLGTGVQESGLRALQQSGGPALGFFQIEPATLADLAANFLQPRGNLMAALTEFAGGWPSWDQQLATNPLFAAAVCRLIYWRSPLPLPDADDLDGLAKYWKRVFNTDEGKGSVAEFVANYRRFLS
jgi:hypothetical protein